MAKKSTPQPAVRAETPVFSESIADALIDAARINVMAAIEARPMYESPGIILPGEELPPNVHECLVNAMEWLNAARELTIELAAAGGKSPTSLHVVAGKAVR